MRSHYQLSDSYSVCQHPYLLQVSICKEKKQFVIVHLNLSKQAMKQVQGVSGLLTDDDACE